MTCLPEPHFQAQARQRMERALRASDPCGAELSIVELVLFACEVSEDAGEVDDLVDAMIGAGAVRLLPRERDPFLTNT